MEANEKRNDWLSPDDDAEVKKDLQKKYGWFLNILYMVLLLVISGYLLVHTVQYIQLYGIDFFNILKIILFAILIVVGLLGLKGIYTEFTKFRNAEFYVKTCRIVDFRGERAGRYTNWYVTVMEGDTVKEYHCKNNPWFSDEQIASKKEITIATFDDVNEEDEISLVYILDKVYTKYRV